MPPLMSEYGHGMQGQIALMHAVHAIDPQSEILGKLLSHGASIHARDNREPRACMAVRQMCELIQYSSVTRAMLALLQITMLDNVAAVTAGHVISLSFCTLADRTKLGNIGPSTLP